MKKIPLLFAVTALQCILPVQGTEYATGQWQIFRKKQSPNASIQYENHALHIHPGKGATVELYGKKRISANPRENVQIVLKADRQMLIALFAYNAGGHWLWRTENRTITPGEKHIIKLPRLPELAQITPILKISSPTNITSLKVSPLGVAPTHVIPRRGRPGELFPVLKEPNLVPAPNFFKDARLTGWRSRGNGLIAQAFPDDEPALLTRANPNGAAVIISDPITVQPGTQYQATCVYHTTDAQFGSFGEFRIIHPKELNNPEEFINAPSIYTNVVNRMLFNCRKNEWRRISWLYTPPEGTHSIRLCILQSGTPANVYWSDVIFSKNEKDSRRELNIWRPPESRLPEAEWKKILKERPDSTAVVRGTTPPEILIDGKIVPSHLYFGDAYNPRKARRQSFGTANIQLQIIRLKNDDVWRGIGNINFAKIDDLIRDSVAKNPLGYYIVGLDVSPWPQWKNQFPDEIARNSSGQAAVDRHGTISPPSYWSATYRRQVLQYLQEAVTHIMNQDYRRAIVGFFPSGNEDFQFYYQLEKKGTLQDGCSPCDSELLGQWLKKKYQTLAAARKAWHDPQLQWETVKSPFTLKKYGGTFWNPATRQKCIDMTRFLSESLSEFVNDMCHTVRKYAGKPVITAMWWGRGAALAVYPFYGQTRIIHPDNALNLTAAQSGYHGVRETASPTFFPWVFDSNRIHEKIMIDEGDYRSWCTPFTSLRYDYHCVRYWTIEEFSNAVLRQFGRMLAVGGGYWWYSISAGWFNHPEIMKFAAELQKSAGRVYRRKASFTPAEIAVVADEDNYYVTTEEGDVWNGPNYHTIRNNQFALQLSGLKYDFYYLKDIRDRKMDGYKIYIFSNLFKITPETLRFINTLKRDNKLLVWLYAPGYVTEKGFSTEHMSETAGINLRLADRKSKLSVFSQQQLPLLKGLNGGNVGLGIDMTGERFVIHDNKVQILATYKIDGAPSIGIRDFGNWKSMYIGLPAGLSPVFLHNIAADAGVHIYNTPGDMLLHHRDDLIVLHGVSGNVNHLNFPENVRLTDFLTGQELKGRTLRLQPGETKIFEIQK